MSQAVNEQNSDAEKPSQSEESKQFYRRKVWEHLDKNNLVVFPRPALGRIPNFKGSDEAAAKLLELEDFKNAKAIEVNPDKSQEAARVLVLENNKTLYVPVPRLKEGLLKHITVPEGSAKNQIKEAISRRGIEYNGKAIGIDEEIKIDLLVLGSVAVSKQGYRIGKGRGYADLEFGILREMNAVTEETVIVTLVHDCQVFDTLPAELFQPYDVPVDFILTPTQIIQVQTPLPRPPGIIWNILSKRRLNLMPVLQALKAKQDCEGKDTTLKEVDTDVETYEPRQRFSKFRRFKRRRTRSEGKGTESQGENNETVRQPRRYTRTRRFFRKGKAPRSESRPNENGDTTGGENSQSASVTRRGFRRNYRPYQRNRLQIDFSLMVSNIERNVRVRDLKKALNDRGIKPSEITWRGYKGFCYLHYAKPNNQSVKSEEPIVVDNVIEILQNLKIGPDSDTSLAVKVLEPISRIETTDVTAV